MNEPGILRFRWLCPPHDEPWAVGISALLPSTVPAQQQENLTPQWACVILVAMGVEEEHLVQCLPCGHRLPRQYQKSGPLHQRDHDDAEARDTLQIPAVRPTDDQQQVQATRRSTGCLMQTPTPFGGYVSKLTNKEMPIHCVRSAWQVHGPEEKRYPAFAIPCLAVSGAFHRDHRLSPATGKRVPGGSVGGCQGEEKVAPRLLNGGLRNYQRKMPAASSLVTKRVSGRRATRRTK